MRSFLLYNMLSYWLKQEICNELNKIKIVEFLDYNGTESGFTSYCTNIKQYVGVPVSDLVIGRAVNNICVDWKLYSITTKEAHKIIENDIWNKQKLEEALLKGLQVSALENIEKFNWRGPH